MIMLPNTARLERTLFRILSMLNYLTMNFQKRFFIILACFLTACNHSSSFDREVWVDNSDMEDTSNPRAWMVQDVMKNHLRTGMSRKAVLDLLGKPYQEGIERRLLKTIALPDSISYRNDENLKPENSDKVMDAIDNFYSLYAKPVMIIRYPVGWSTIDPNFLIIKLNGKRQVEEYWVEQS